MDIEKIVNLVVQQIPLLIMSINNGSSISTFIPLLLVPLLIYLIKLIPDIISYFTKHIPRNYVRYTFGDELIRGSYHVDFFDCLSNFLNDFVPESIRKGKIKKYDSLPYDPKSILRQMYAIISPDNGYFYKLVIDDEIIQKINKTGYQIPPTINLKKITERPIFVTMYIFHVKEVVNNTNNNRNEMQDIKKDFVTISAFDMQIAKDLIYIIINYDSYKSNNISNFRLRKAIYYAEDTDRDKYSVTSSPINVNKNYHNVFLTEKNHQLIVKSINDWDNNAVQQLEYGIPNKLSFLLIGCPGCGKTSLIYAIANETKKHIVSINMQDLSNKIFLKMMASIENRVVVFDDVDANIFTHKRKIDNTNEKNNSLENIQLAIMAASDKKENFLSKYEKKMTLDVFLEVLDGYSYLNNCIVILTSNHPELLDPAIIRPGRIDHVIEFNLCDEYQFKNIFQYFVGKDYKEVDSDFVFESNLYSTSYIINTVILPNRNNPTKILELLKKIDS